MTGDSDRITVPEASLVRLMEQVQHLAHVAFEEGRDHGSKCRGLRELERAAKATHEAQDAFIKETAELLEIFPRDHR